MSLKAAYILPHPPLIVEEIGLGREKEILKTKESYEKVAHEIENINPDTIIISSPHTKTYIDGFYISKGTSLKGSFKNFGAENITFDEEIDNQLVDEIEKINNKFYNIPISLEADIELDHGTMVPLYFIRNNFQYNKTCINVSKTRNCNYEIGWSNKCFYKKSVCY